MLTGIHFLLTYACTFSCDHCFLYCSPNSEGTFTRAQLRRAFDDIARLGTIETVYFEGGEPFLYYPLMLDGLRMARGQGLKSGIVTNCYWATSEDDASIWLEPLVELGVVDLSLSDDAFHHGDNAESPAQFAQAAAEKLELPVGTICIEPATVATGNAAPHGKGAPVIGGGVRFRGRAVEKLIDDLPRTPAGAFTECPDEDLENPGRVHVDSYGNVHICQGISMGNMWRTPLTELLRRYDPRSHPICGPLLQGGPACLAREYDVKLEGGYVDACHLCYRTRRALLDRFPEHLTPRQVYGIT